MYSSAIDYSEQKGLVDDVRPIVIEKDNDPFSFK
jgi:hypothetical protein